MYGPRQNPLGEAGVVAIFTKKLIQGEQPVINGDGKQTRDYVFSGDAVEANLLVLDDRKSDIYNIGTGIETDVNALFRMINELTRCKAKEKHGPPAKGEQLRSVISSEKIFEKLDWKPATSLPDGLKLTLDYYKKLK